MQQLNMDNAQNAVDSTFYDRFAGIIFQYLLQQVSNEQDAEDLLLEVFLAALQNTSLTGLPAVRQLAWLRRVARNKIIDHYRHTTLFSIQPLEQTQQTEDQSLTPERQAEEQEKWTWLSQAIEQLPPVQRELIRLRYVQELRLTQIEH